VASPLAYALLGLASVLFGPSGAVRSARHPVKVKVAGSSPVWGAHGGCWKDVFLQQLGRAGLGEVAQLAEHATENRGVGSSILPLATTRTRGLAEDEGQDAELANPSSEADILAPSRNLRTSSAR
jgi:hypothetical protein